MKTPNELFRELVGRDIIGRLEGGGAFDRGYYFDPKTWKITTRFVPTGKRPWIHFFKGDGLPNRNCAYLRDLVWKGLGHIPHYCRTRCFKTIVVPESFHDMMQLMERMEKWSLNSKIGIELRKYVPRAYGTYFYSEDIDEARRTEAFLEEKLPHRHVFTKRACTEMEMAHGPTSAWPEITVPELELEARLARYCDMPSSQVPQPKPFKDYIILRWFEYAFQRGDESVYDYNGGRPLVTPPDVY
jgi:hypothetical protein